MSEVWSYFQKEIDSKNVKCKECGQILTRNDYSTSSMLRHLQKIHNLLPKDESKKKVKILFCNHIYVLIIVS